jgi:Fe-S oxidoreductase
MKEEVQVRRGITTVEARDLCVIPYLPAGVDGKGVTPLSPEQLLRIDCSFDGVTALGLSAPKSAEEEERLVTAFLDGLRKLFQPDSNWTFLQPLTLTMDNCARCQTCANACPIYVASGGKEIYRPTFRSDLLRKIKQKYLGGHKLWARLTGNDIRLDWTTIARLAESSYRCTLCRRCAQACPMGVDNGLVAREIRKLLSQELAISPKELHRLGTIQQLKVGSSTGMNPAAFSDIKEFMEDDLKDRTGKKIEIPVDRQGADVLLLHNAGEFLAWPENPEAFAVILNAAGVDWTLSSRLSGYDGVNYGAWYDDVQLARIAITHARVAHELGAKRIVVGECGHATKALVVTADSLLTGALRINRESCLPLLQDLVLRDAIHLDAARNDFPVVLHDPCNLVRLAGIVEPQRRILQKVCPQFREMTPSRTDNYCCGGGSGFAIMSSYNFPDWRMNVSGRLKVKQILDAFRDCLDPSIKKYVCAPCSNCKGQIRDLLSYYELDKRYNIVYGGLVDLIANAMTDIPRML